MERVSRNDLKAGPRGILEKPLNSWIVKRLKLLAETTGAPVPSAEVLKRLAGALSGFTEKAIDKACFDLESKAQGDYRRLPTPHELVQACERAAIPETKKERWCGRCNMGMIRLGNEWVRCECNCSHCDNSGWIVEQVAPHLPMPYKTTGYAVRCDHGRFQ